MFWKRSISLCESSVKRTYSRAPFLGIWKDLEEGSGTKITHRGGHAGEFGRVLVYHGLE